MKEQETHVNHCQCWRSKGALPLHESTENDSTIAWLACLIDTCNENISKHYKEPQLKGFSVLV